MATLEHLKPQAALDPLQQLEKQIHEAREALGGLPGHKYYEELLSIIRRPGWTTKGEEVYFEELVDLILVYTANLSQLHQQLMDAAKGVPTK